MGPMTQRINQWPEQERPREKLLLLGRESLSHAELLAILIGVGIPGKSALDIARDALIHFKGLRHLLGADLKSLLTFPGLGPSKIARLFAALELGRRYLQTSIEHHGIIDGAQDAKAFLSASLRDHKQEVFACLFLNNKHHVIQFEKLFHGSINSAAIYPREVVKRALHYNASAVIAAHNHPSGIAEPSRSDVEITTQLSKALALVDIRLLDHLIIGDVQVVSLAERGELLR